MLSLPTVLALTYCLTGTVTHVARDRYNSGVIEPVGGGAPLWFAGEIMNQQRATLKGADALSVGDVVEMKGESSTLGFAPGLAVETITFLKKGSLEPAAEVTLRDLANGTGDNTRVALRGVLVKVLPTAGNFTRLMLKTTDGTFAANVPARRAEWNALLDAELLLSGVAMSVFNIRGEFIGVQLEVHESDSVSVVQAPTDPFLSPIVPLDRILSYSPDGIDLHRRHVKGVVTYVEPGQFVWLQAENRTLKIYGADLRAQPGDKVEAVGFASREYGLGVLVSASLQVKGFAGLPEPAPVTWMELKDYKVDEVGQFQNYDGRYVELEGDLLSFVSNGARAGLILSTDGEHPHEKIRIEIDLANSEGLALSPEDVTWEPCLRVKGVLELVQEVGFPEGQIPAIQGWRLKVATAKAIQVVHNEAWKSHVRESAWTFVQYGMGGVGVVAFVVLLVFLLRFSSEKRRLSILSAERKRMAADLHDTLEQHLAGARMMLNTAVEFSKDVPAEVKAAVANANEILAHAKAEVRARVYDMRSDVLFSQGPEKVLKGMANRLNLAGRVHVRTHLRGLPESLPEALFSELVFIIGEAVTNAIKHGKCQTIILASDPLPARRGNGFALSVANDGEPFDPAKALGPEAGHYGLSGMRERARRAGIRLEFFLKDRWMTLRLEVPCES